MRLAQFALLWATAWLTYLAGRHAVGHRAALAGGILVAAYPPWGCWPAIT